MPKTKPSIECWTTGNICPDIFSAAFYAYRGAYAAINRIMLENVGSNYRFVNREQDLGIEGLRKVKLEYNPVRFIKKYGVAAEY